MWFPLSCQPKRSPPCRAKNSQRNAPAIHSSSLQISMLLLRESRRGFDSELLPVPVCGPFQLPAFQTNDLDGGLRFGALPIQLGGWRKVQNRSNVAFKSRPWISGHCQMVNINPCKHHVHQRAPHSKSDHATNIRTGAPFFQCDPHSNGATLPPANAAIVTWKTTSRLKGHFAKMVVFILVCVAPSTTHTHTLTQTHAHIYTYIYIYTWLLLTPLQKVFNVLRV